MPGQYLGDGSLCVDGCCRMVVKCVLRSCLSWCEGLSSLILLPRFMASLRVSGACPSLSCKVCLML